MRKTKTTVLIVIAIILAVAFLIPLLWMLSTSVKTDVEALTGKLNIIPKHWTWENYTNAFQNADGDAPVLRWIGNSVFVGVAGTLLVLIVDSLAAYGLARLDVPFKKTIFTLFIMTLMVPGVVFFIPQFLEFNSFGLVDTYWALILPYSANAFGVFLLYQFFRGFPREIEEAAYIDGANKWKIFIQVLVPNSVPILSTLAILTFMGIYNDFIWPTYVTSSDSMRTITAGVALVAQGAYTQSYAKLMTLTTIATIPVMVVFIAGQKFFVKAVTQSGIK